jgi:hypothetical protein
MKVRLLIIMALMQLTGCASSGISPMNKDTYFVSEMRSMPGIGPATGAKADIYLEANEFCVKMNKHVETVSLEMVNAVPFRPGSASLEFKCVQ